MAPINTYRDLIARQRSFTLGMRVYALTRRFPPYEGFGLVSRLQRGVVSISSNIAAGYGRGTTRDYLRFMNIARAALYELDTQPLYAVELAYLSPDDHHAVESMLDECERVLAGLIRGIERTDRPRL